MKSTPDEDSKINLKPRRYIQDGLMIYSSTNMHHQRSGVRGWLYKRP